MSREMEMACFKNLAYVFVYKEKGEIEDIQWSPINFHCYSNGFHDLITEAVEEALDAPDGMYEVIMRHEHEFDGAGALLGEHFEIVHVEKEHRPVTVSFD